MRRPDYNATSILFGFSLFILAFIISSIYQEISILFVMFLGLLSSWLMIFPLCSRYILVKKLIEQGEDPRDMKRLFLIDFVIFKI